MKTLIVLSSIFFVAAALPQQQHAMRVVQPNHYLQPGTFGKEGHLLPESFYTNGQQVEIDVKRNIPDSAPQPLASIPESARQTIPSSPITSNIPESADVHSQDSYSNIGGLSGRVASVLTNTNEYGEVVPKAFSNLDRESYAYYHGHQK